ncbi:hypothetical protein D3C74_300000 [compost metagenome]
MLEHNSFRISSRTRGIDDVSQMLWAGNRLQVATFSLIQCGILKKHGIGMAMVLFCQLTTGQKHCGLAVFQHVFNTRGRKFGIDWHISTTCFENGQQTYDHFH